MIASAYALAAVVALVTVLALLGAFQIALAAGAPLGRFAWGGKSRVLPSRQRLGSVVSVVIYAVIAAVALDRAGQIDILPDLLSRIAMWVVVGFFALSIIPNLMTSSRPERSVMVPVAALLAVLSLLVALG